MWKVLENHGEVHTSAEGCWRCPHICGRIWKDVEGSERMWKDVEDYGMWESDLESFKVILYILVHRIAF